MLPAASSARPPPVSMSAPPSSVENTRPDPAAFSFVIVTSKPPFGVVSYAPGVVGKSAELLKPSTTARPLESTAMRSPLSTALPPRNVE